MAANNQPKEETQKVGQELEKAAALITNDDFDASAYQKRDSDLNKDGVLM